MKNIKYIVLTERRGKLYIQIPEENMCLAIKNPYDYIPKDVELVKVNEQHYIKGFEPKVELKKFNKKN